MTHTPNNQKEEWEVRLRNAGYHEDMMDFVREILSTERKRLVERLEEMDEQNEVTQAILGALEYRGFYDAGKYLDGSIWERVKPIIIRIIQEG